MVCVCAVFVLRGVLLEYLFLTHRPVRVNGYYGKIEEFDHISGKALIAFTGECGKLFWFHILYRQLIGSEPISVEGVETIALLDK